ncbi:hypothetical protein AB0K92_24220 [Streptomyces sp. NPDC052687]|uniref:hypothetical protein n=1 Tax=Streptomyces sp. NPDC052687 TaxID=3154759 RepID=UPI00342F62B4
MTAPEAAAAPDTAPAQGCYHRDGYPPGGGRNIGGSPPKYKSGARVKWEMPAGYGDYDFMVQACNRGGSGQRSHCTNWSPQLYLNAR